MSRLIVQGVGAVVPDVCQHRRIDPHPRTPFQPGRWIDFHDDVRKAVAERRRQRTHNGVVLFEIARGQHHRARMEVHIPYALLEHDLVRGRLMELGDRGVSVVPTSRYNSGQL